MASTQFRITGLATGGGDLTLSKLELHGTNGRVDVGATITSSHAPVSGVVSALGDGDELTTCTFSAGDVEAPGFWIAIETPATQDVVGMEIGGVLYAVNLCEKVANAWVTLIDAQNSNGLPTIVASEPFVQYPTVASDLSAVFGYLGNVNPTIAATANGVSIGTSSISPVFAKITKSPKTRWTGLRAKLVFKILADPFNRRHVGFFFHDAENSTGGYRVVLIDTKLAYSTYVAGNEAPGSGGDILNVGTTSIGQVKTIEIFVGPLGQITAHIDGQVVGTVTTTNLPFTNVVGGVFVYGATMEVQSFEIQNSTPPVIVTGGYTWAANISPKVLPPPVATLPQGLGGITSASANQTNDIEFGGNGRVYGTVERKNTPANVPLRRRVRLHRSRDGMLVRETWSKPDGTYEFKGIDTRYEYDTIAWDHEMSYRSVIANNLKPEAM